MRSFFEDPELQKFMLVLVRLSGLVVFSPPFFNKKLSMQLKGGLVLALTLALFPVVRSADVVLQATFMDLGIALVFELLIGFIIGFSMQLLFSAFQMMGELIDRNIGFMMANLVDPQTDVTISLMSSLFMNLGLFAFIVLGGHLWLIETFSGSFRTIPLLETNVQMNGVVYHIMGLFFNALSFAMEMALPVIILMTLVYMAQGFLMRTIPQLQIFAIGFILTISLGLMSVRLILGQFMPLAENFFDEFEQEVWLIISTMSYG